MMMMMMAMMNEAEKGDEISSGPALEWENGVSWAGLSITGPGWRDPTAAAR